MVLLDGVRHLPRYRRRCSRIKRNMIEYSGRFSDPEDNKIEVIPILGGNGPI